ncbi:MAG: metallophosphoesterase [Mycobacteriales bacterium]
MEERGCRSRLRPWLEGRAAVTAVGLLSAAAAMTAWGTISHDIGPLETRLSLVPSLSGGITVGVPPLGRLELPTHAGPLQVSATVTGIDPARARALLGASNPGRTVTAQVTADSQDALAAAAARSLLVALAAAALTCAVVFRRRRAVLGGTAMAALALAASATVAATTLRTEALNEPTFDGLLIQAPALIGRVQDFDAYSERLAQLTANVAGVYGSLATLPAAPPADSTRVLWVSDIHNNPQSFTVMSQLLEQFDVSAIVDTGDIVDVGSEVENRLLSRIGTFGVPYLYARGNHDSRIVTQAFIEKQPNARALEAGEVVEVAGIRFAGIGDPLFRPNKAQKGDAEANEAKLLAAGERLLAAIDDDPAPVDVVLVHNPKVAEPLFGRVPLILDGHTHERRHRTGAGTLELTQGSSGGAGLRTLDEGEALPLQMSVLHFDEVGALLAVDDITVGGLGQRSVTVERRAPSSYGDLSKSAEPPV